MAVYPFSQMPQVVAKMNEGMKMAVDAAVVLIAQEGVMTMIDHTPVDTTNAVSNWRVSTGVPLTTIVKPLVPGSTKGSGASAARNIAKTRAAGKLQGSRSVKNVYITNNVPYISVLEYGDSKHRPNGMVAKGLQAMAARARSIQIIKN